MRVARFPCTLIVVLSVFSAIGCAPMATVRSVHDSAFHGQISRLTVVIGEGNYPNDAKQLSTFLRKELATRHIESHFVAVGKDRNLEEVALEQFQPDAVLTIVPNLVIQSQFGMRVKVRYDASVWLKQTPDRRIWRAEVEHTCTDADISCRESDMSYRLKAMASRLVQSLVADGLLTPQGRATNPVELQRR
jgi:hypothetical protein